MSNKPLGAEYDPSAPYNQKTKLHNVIVTINLEVEKPEDIDNGDLEYYIKNDLEYILERLSGYNSTVINDITIL